MTDLVCFYGQRFSCLKEIDMLLTITLKGDRYPKRVIRGQNKIKLRPYQSKGKSKYLHKQQNRTNSFHAY